jgi:hypothetical protein
MAYGKWRNFVIELRRVLPVQHPVKLTGVSELNQDGDVDSEGEVGALAFERPPV